MISSEQKLAIGAALQEAFTALGSWKAVGRKVEANEVTVRYNMIDPTKWFNVSDKKWISVGTALGLSINAPRWNVVDTRNTQMMRAMLADAQEQAMFLAISHKAGQGKSVSIALHKQADATGGTYVLECEESWSHKLFLQKLAGTLGIATDGLTVPGLTDEIVAFFKRRSATVSPLLILDEANKLKPSSLRLIIPLYNKLKGDMGLVIVGADDLERHIKNGVRRDVRGYDELDSRLGRKFMHLYGTSLDDVRAICAANGVTDHALQSTIWHEMRPQRVTNAQGKYEELVQDDLRRLERAILNLRLKQSRAH